MRFVIFFGILITSLSSYTEKPSQGKKLEYVDKSYEEEIRTVQLYLNTGNPQDMFSPPVAPINQNGLTLEFDDLVESHEEYRVRIIHCNSDWKPSRLKTLDYLRDYNEFMINTFEYSVDTKVSYVHYTFRLPLVKLPGNYLLVAYRGSDQSDIILSKRFMIYQRNVGINILSNYTGLTSPDRQKQRIDFEISYPNYELFIPNEPVNVVIRQNQRWDNAIFGLQPRFTKEAQRILEYQFFDEKKDFFAGNEFRFFDLRSLRYPGQNVGRVDLSTYPISSTLMTDQSRHYQAYAQYDDINGDYYIQNTDTGNGKLQSDYVTTEFTLKPNLQVNGNVYVVGKMNNYSRSSDNKMSFDAKTGTYNTEIILKQGFYNYQYIVAGDTLTANYFEGNHYETENEYEILVFHRPANLGADILVGYTRTTLNPRN